MSAHAIAMQGIGYGAQLTAVQGFGPVGSVGVQFLQQSTGRGLSEQQLAEDEIIIAVIIAAHQAGVFH